MSESSLPSVHRALILSDRSKPLEVQTIATPQPTPGNAILRVVAARIVPYLRDVYDGTRPYRLILPMVAGSGGIARVVNTGPDAVALKPGQLVFIDPTIRARDNPDEFMLMGMEIGSGPKLMEGEWRDGSFAEYVKMPLENVYPLDEVRLVNELGYTPVDLVALSFLAVPAAGLRDIGLQPGETIIVAPATGSFGAAAVKVAIAMGARVIAMGRDTEKLKHLARHSDRIIPLPITGDEASDRTAIQAHGPIDAFLDISPPAASKSSHLKSAFRSLRHHGRASLMGGIWDDIAVPHDVLLFKEVSLKGKWMFSREDFQAVVQMVEKDLLKLGEDGGWKMMGDFGLDDWDEAFTAAKKNDGIGMVTIMKP